MGLDKVIKDGYTIGGSELVICGYAEQVKICGAPAVDRLFGIEPHGGDIASDISSAVKNLLESTVSK